MSKNRNKNNSHSSEKASVPQQQQQQADDVAKKSLRVAAKAESAPVPSVRSGSGGRLTLLSALLYVLVAAGVAFASLYVQRELSDLRRVSSGHGQAAERSAAAAREAERALQQVDSVRASLEAMEQAVAGVRADIEGTNQVLQTGAAHTRKLEDTLQALQSRVSQDQSAGIQEEQDARKRDISSLERSLEDRLSLLSQAITQSVETQSRDRDELEQLRSHLEERDTQTVPRQELEALNSALASLRTADEVLEGNAAVLREQIAAVSAELQTRNTEVASLSQELSEVRTLLQSMVGALRDELKDARASVQVEAERTKGLGHDQQQLSSALQSLDSRLRDQLLHLGERIRAAEESQDALGASLTEQSDKLSKYEEKRMEEEEERRALRADLQELGSSMEELQNKMEASPPFNDEELKMEAIEGKESKLEAIREEELELEAVRDEEPKMEAIRDEEPSSSE